MGIRTISYNISHNCALIPHDPGDGSREIKMSEPPRPSYPSLPSPFHNTSAAPALIFQGAEGHLFKTVFLDAFTPAALKIRPSKPYRHKILDQRLTKQRVLAEARVLVKLGNAGLIVPAVYALDWHGEGKWQEGDFNRAANGGAWLLMEWIEGNSVRQLLQERDGLEKGGFEVRDHAGEEAVRQLLRRVGRAIGEMHSIGGVVHGDLTSSNIMVRQNSHNEGELNRPASHPDQKLSLEGEIVLIDFGLATQSIQDEDRAVDLYVLERAFGSTHPKQEAMFAEEVLQSPSGYRGSFKGSQVVLKKLEEVRLRGRKRSMVG